MPRPRFRQLGRASSSLDSGYLGDLGARELQHLRSFQDLVRSQCDSLAQQLVEQYASTLEELHGRRCAAEASAEPPPGRAPQCRGSGGGTEAPSELRGQAEAPCSQPAAQAQDPAGQGGAAPGAAQAESPARVVGHSPKSSRRMTRRARTERPGAASACEMHLPRVRRLVLFADMSPECDDECALLYLLSDLNNKEIPLTIDLIMADSQVRFLWMGYLFHDKFTEEGNWTSHEGGTGFSMGCVQVNFFLLHSAQREDMVIKDFKNKAPFLKLDGPDNGVRLNGVDHEMVEAGPADVILMAAPVPDLDPRFFSRFTGVEAIYVVGTPGGVNCQQPSWSNLLYGLYQLAPVVYLAPQFTRTVCFPKAYVEDNPHWTWYMKRTVFDMALTCMARRPEIPAKFGDWGLVLRLNAANAKLCQSWFGEVVGEGIDDIASCPAHIKMIVEAYVDRNSGEDRNIGGVVAELQNLGVMTPARLDDSGRPVSHQDLKTIQQAYREQLFKSVYVCVATTETLLFQNELNFQTSHGTGHFRTLRPRCGYSAPLQSLATIFGVDEAIDILRDLPVQALTPAYDMVGAICVLSFLETGSIDGLGLQVQPADESMGTKLLKQSIVDSLQEDSPHDIWFVGEQSEEVIDSVVDLLNSQVANDPLLVVNEFWAKWPQTVGRGLPDDRAAQRYAISEAVSVVGSFSSQAMGPAWPQRFVIHPASNFRLAWTVASLVLIFYDCVTVPLQVFGYQEALTTITFTAVFWSIDFCLSFFVGYYEQATTELRLQRIVCRYLKTWFIIDIVAVGTDWVIVLANELFSMNANTVAIVRLLRAVRSVRLLKLTKMPRTTNSVEEKLGTSRLGYAIKIVKMVCLIFGANHFVACGWYYLTTRDAAVNWVVHDSLQESSKLYLYATSLHWAFAHLLLGEIDVSPTNTWERFYSVAMHLVGLIVFSSFVSSLTEYMAQIAGAEAEHNRRDGEVRQYFEEHMVSLKLTNQIENYRRHAKQSAQRQKLPRDQIPGLREIPESLAIRLSAEVYVPPLVRHGFFRSYRAKDREGIALTAHRTMKELSMLPASDLFLKGQAASYFYLVVQGSLSYFQAAERGVLEAGAGQWVSELALWLGAWRCRGRLESRTVCDLLSLDIAEFRKCVTETLHSGLLACKYADLVARDINRQGLHFSSLTDLWMDSEDRNALAERAAEESHW